jgi:hypothetical protein
MSRLPCYFMHGIFTERKKINKICTLGLKIAAKPVNFTNINE